MHALSRIGWFSLAGFLVALGATVALATPNLPGWPTLGPAVGSFLVGLGVGISCFGWFLTKTAPPPDGQILSGESPVAVIDHAEEQRAAIRVLRERICADNAVFSDQFWPEASGAVLERTLMNLDTSVSDSRSSVTSLINNVNLLQVRRAAEQFYSSWQATADHYEEAVHREREERRSGRVIEGPQVAELVSRATSALDGFLISTDPYLSSVGTSIATAAPAPPEATGHIL